MFLFSCVCDFAKKILGEIATSGRFLLRKDPLKWWNCIGSIHFEICIQIKIRAHCFIWIVLFTETGTDVSNFVILRLISN